ncbi:hypothetical protein [Nostoc sp. 'Peltigera malacea cyanobiont' DB3992]|uniref:hypothetical protein n=1 Tax=Nostoc sp. 'Peltigera malacea cyanobiont' DB3992 TaxID=1206980 RepID=UPI0015D4C45A|nr:hypothetical protein [Nostoc sp. 'Peltigera malacea cyanobiont' DB3992]
MFEYPSIRILSIKAIAVQHWIAHFLLQYQHSQVKPVGFNPNKSHAGNSAVLN